jgi:hypothetical protein
LNQISARNADVRPRNYPARPPRNPRAGGTGGPKRRGRSLAALALAIGVPAFAAPSEWQALALPSFTSGESRTVVPMGFETPGESFPGSAFYYLEDLPFVPADEMDPDQAIDEASDLPAGPAARAFVLGGSQLDKARALKCLTLAIYYEAASESDSGQRAVAQVVLNRVAHPSYPNSVCGVVFQGSERSTGCQFSFTCDGALARQPSRRFWDRAQKVASAALGGAVYRPVGLATHYHTVWIHPYWADSLAGAGTIGAHRFYRWKGLAGLPGAFTAAYAGNEPLPAPKPRSRSAAEPIVDPIELARLYEQAHPLPVTHRPTTPAAAAAQAPAPAYSAAAEARGGEAQFGGTRLPESGTVREEYSNSGQWISRP